MHECSCVWQHEPNIQDCFPHGGGDLYVLMSSWFSRQIKFLLITSIINLLYRLRFNPPPPKNASAAVYWWLDKRRSQSHLNKRFCGRQKQTAGHRLRNTNWPQRWKWQLFQWTGMTVVSSKPWIMRAFGSDVRSSFLFSSKCIICVETIYRFT